MCLKIKNIAVDYIKHRKHETFKQVKPYVNGQQDTWGLLCCVCHMGGTLLCAFLKVRTETLKTVLHEDRQMSVFFCVLPALTS